MKFLKAFILIVVVLGSFVMFSPQVFSQEVNALVDEEDNGNYLMMRTFEIYGFKQSTMFITDEHGLTEEIKLVSTNSKVSKTAENMELITSKLNELKGKGYKLVSVSSGGFEGVLTTTYLFEAPL